MSRSDVRAVPFCSWLKDLVPSMSDISAGHSVEWTDVRATAILGMEAPGQLPGTLSQVVQMSM